MLGILADTKFKLNLTQYYFASFAGRPLRTSLRHASVIEKIVFQFFRSAGLIQHQK